MTTLTGPIGLAGPLGAETASPPEPGAVRRLTCTGIEQVARAVKTFRFAPCDGYDFDYEAGQYVTVLARIDGRDIGRCFTLSSTPSRPGLALTVKRKPAGAVSTWLHDRMRVGDEIDVVGPVGYFTLASDSAASYAFIAAGSGITPVMSMARRLIDAGKGADIAFVYSAATPDDVIFDAELDAMAASGAHVRTILTRRAAPGGPAPARLNAGRLLALVPDLAVREIFVCGPEGFRSMAVDAASAAGADSGRVHTESFVIGGDADAAPGGISDPGGVSAASSATATFTVTFQRRGRVIDCPADSTVLEAAGKAGLSLPSSCTEGICGTCKSTLTGGAVDMHHQGGITPAEIDAGRFLPCCSKPTDDLVVDA
ncbi:flavin reductase family protein [Spelaeicoccus albus]|uniref:Ferredoxin-NADP reductase n=1 Tax=Spelaeicoccus albus TaxID=1280376 RepID=A0A7Z0A9T5_9MICO|nr:iron-sulfur cluster-binding domain-containing protein [Spelaeicoccus albus]NYI66180.1 ferredoxin-NADP reductase [Spelaeicoccus albus]